MIVYFCREEEKEKKKISRNKKIKRFALIGLATVGGGTLIGQKLRLSLFYIYKYLGFCDILFKTYFIVLVCLILLHQSSVHEVFL